MRVLLLALSIVVTVLSLCHFTEGWISPEQFLALQNSAKPNTAERTSVKKCREYKNLVAEETGVINGGGIFADESGEDGGIGFKEYKCDHTTGLITGGQITEKGEFPHMAAIGWKKPELKFSCGGSLISDKFVLTVAHCSYNSEGHRPEFVRLGDQNLASNDDKLEPVDYDIKRFIMHDNYDYFKRTNDVAVIELVKQVMFTINIRPACLSQEVNFKGRVVATGWGQTATYSETSEELRKVGLSTVNDEECIASIGISSLDLGQVCVFGEGNKDTCRGDSGGPIQVSHSDATCVYDIIGLTSYGTTKCGSNSTALYTRVEPYIDWIEEQVWSQ